jgi:hypothetical protein
LTRPPDLHSLPESHLLADFQHTSSSSEIITGAVTVAALAALFYAARRMRPPTEPPVKFTDETLTASFTAAIPTITRELNLEVATATQTETFTRSSAKTALWGWVDLGTNVAQVRAPVTYRYHIRLREPWELRVTGQTVRVRAPVIRASLPPAIHTDGIERLHVRGWCRASPRDLAEQLERDITPLLSAQATAQLEQVRQSCRLSVAEFVRLWLEREGHWAPGVVSAIQVRFADEVTPPSDSLLKLTD